jgi:hypothetical protein
MAGVKPDEGVLVGASDEIFIEAASKGRTWSREPKVRTIY